MTSEATDAETKQFFERHAFFGLPRDNVVFFRQDDMPCVFPDGRLILESRSAVPISLIPSSLPLQITLAHVRWSDRASSERERGSVRRYSRLVFGRSQFLRCTGTPHHLTALEKTGTLDDMVRRGIEDVRHVIFGFFFPPTSLSRLPPC